MKKHKHHARRFTIVELLIVIVVIGILAALALNTYGNVQQRAQVSKTDMTVKAYIKGLKLFMYDNGQMPQTDTCLGPASALRRHNPKRQ